MDMIKNKILCKKWYGYNKYTVLINWTFLIIQISVVFLFFSFMIIFFLFQVFLKFYNGNKISYIGCFSWMRSEAGIWAWIVSLPVSVFFFSLGLNFFHFKYIHWEFYLFFFGRFTEECSDMCYQIRPGGVHKKSWREARTECQKLNATLMSVRSAQDLACIEKVMQYSSDGMWIGLEETWSAEVNNFTWRWMNGDFLSTNWDNWSPGIVQ